MKNFDIDIDFENKIPENIDIDIEQKFDIVPCLFMTGISGKNEGKYVYQVSQNIKKGSLLRMLVVQRLLFKCKARPQLL